MGCLIASIPGVPFGFPGLGFPPVPYPPVPLLAYLLPPPLPPEPPELPPELPELENLGAGADEPLPLEEPPLPEVGEPAGLYVVPVGALDGATGTLNGLFGAVAILGEVGVGTPVGLTDGFAAAGALTGVGLAGAGLAGVGA